VSIKSDDFEDPQKPSTLLGTIPYSLTAMYWLVSLFDKQYLENTGGTYTLTIFTHC